MKRLALLSAAALLAGGAALGAVTAPAHVMPAVADPAPVPTATATATPTPTPTETFTGIAVGPDTPSPAPVIPQAGSPVKGAPLEAPAPAPVPACPAPTLPAEDGSCVNPDFWDTPAPAPEVPVIQEDDPAWNCLVHGNKVCGPNPLQRVEAWGKFQTSSVPADVLRQAFSVTYMGTAMPGIDFPPSQYVTIPSAVTVNRVHVFRVETAP